jgi:hypothetical protein
MHERASDMDSVPKLTREPSTTLRYALPRTRAAQGVPFFKANPTPEALALYATELLRLARCVRAHGVPNFPDPSSLGPNDGVGFVLDRNTLDSHSPALQAALTACQSVALGVRPGFRSYG